MVLPLALASLSEAGESAVSLSQRLWTRHTTLALSGMLSVTRRTQGSLPASEVRKPVEANAKPSQRERRGLNAKAIRRSSPHATAPSRRRQVAKAEPGASVDREHLRDASEGLQVKHRARRRAHRGRSGVHTDVTMDEGFSRRDLLAQSPVAALQSFCLASLQGSFLWSVSIMAVPHDPRMYSSSYYRRVSAVPGI